MHFSITELLLIAFIVLILFGTKKLRNIGQDLGGAVKGFKDGMKSEENPSQPPADSGRVIDVNTDHSKK